jgi:hypothetical protein
VKLVVGALTSKVDFVVKVGSVPHCPLYFSTSGTAFHVRVIDLSAFTVAVSPVGASGVCAYIRGTRRINREAIRTPTRSIAWYLVELLFIP